MPYNTNAALPDNVKNYLPKHGQEIYRKAFNNAWERYKDKSLRQANETHEEVSHKVAWSAVKRVFVKNNDEVWVER